ncbi:MAG: 3-hydroxybutyryl-CoA dehydrogenase [bacterium]|nr:3-hydroxybutyryl-CoA dehydrogenase [bacterium]MDE0239937.1 3-hydroxybutyryl-CoA dehydrogenase [bacterium]MDE0416178.1 3-hydroxybutyryl-CoA dehydrogenase [bacterium]
MEIRSIGVIGAGQMGSGIAHVCALAGYDILIIDMSRDLAEAGVEVVRSNMERQLRRDVIDQDQMDAALGRIAVVDSYADLADCDCVIEAATENEKVKKEILAELTSSLKADAIICTNTSSIPITRLAAATDRPEKFMGMHFMNPVPMMNLVELIRGLATDGETFDTIRALTLELGKVPANAEDFPAFIVNRILLPMINEAVYALYEGVGTVESIDTAMRLGANHPMGPLELADFIGLDICYSVMQVLYDGLADTKYRPCPLLAKYVEAGWLGRKSGRGFYDYSSEPPIPTR